MASTWSASPIPDEREEPFDGSGRCQLGEVRLLQLPRRLDAASCRSGVSDRRARCARAGRPTARRRRWRRAVPSTVVGRDAIATGLGESTASNRSPLVEARGTSTSYAASAMRGAARLVERERHWPARRGASSGAISRCSPATNGSMPTDVSVATTQPLATASTTRAHSKYGLLAAVHVQQDPRVGQRLRTCIARARTSRGRRECRAVPAEEAQVGAPLPQHPAGAADERLAPRRAAAPGTRCRSCARRCAPCHAIHRRHVAERQVHRGDARSDGSPRARTG